MKSAAVPFGTAALILYSEMVYIILFAPFLK